MRIAFMNKLRALRGICSGSAAYGPPEIATIYILSGACTGHCVMCRHFSPLGPSQERGQEDFPFEALCALLDDFDAMGVGYVNLCADGEPFLYRAIAPLLERLRAGRMRYNFMTNGTVITGEHIRLMDKKTTLYVSMHSARPEVWSAITGMSRERFPEVLSTVRRARDAGVRVVLHSVITNRHADELPALLTSAVSLGVTELSISPFTVYNERLSSLKMSREVFERFTGSLPGLIKEARHLGVKTNFDAFAALSYSDTGSFCIPDADGRCSIGWLMTWIDPAGNVRYCPQDTRIMGNTRTASFRNIWYGPEYTDARSRAATADASAMCRECAVYTVNAAAAKAARLLRPGRK